MKQVAKSLVVVGAMLAAGSAVADMDMDFKPFIGVDYMQAWMPGKNTSEVNAKDVFRKSYPGATVYIGSKFTENFGIELGADWSTAKTKTSNYVDEGFNVAFSNKARRKGYHADLVGFLPIDCWELFGSLGYGSVKLDIKDQAFVVTGGTAAQNAAAQAFASSELPISVKRKGVFRAGVGASYMFTDMFGVRAKLGFEGTGSLRFKDNEGESVKAFKNSTTLAAGVFVRW